MSRYLQLAVVLAAMAVLSPAIPSRGARGLRFVEPWPELTARIPPRSLDACSGSRFATLAAALDPSQRRQAIHDELLAGNLPPFQRQLKPVRLTWKDRRGIEHEAYVFVTPDYLSIGSDEDFLRMPMGLYTAVSVARSFAFVLPTRKIVDAIYHQADVRLAPRPMRPGPRMTSVDYLWRHNQMIEAQLAGHLLGELAAGDKKDLVLTNRLLRKAQRVAIYGWHQDSSSPIQPLSTVHGGRYADYSHGVRLVSATVVVDGQPRSVFDVLEDPGMAGLLSYEGTVPAARQIMSLPFQVTASPNADPGQVLPAAQR